MHKILSFRLLLGLVAALALTLSASAQTQVGAIKAVKVQGQVTKLLADGSQKALGENEALIETDTVVTGAASSVVLVFANGSSVKLAPKSKLAIEEFKMDPLADSIAVAQLKAEPTVSKTSLNLAYGEMVGNVKKLNAAGGSTFNVKTPVGAAGIRGTTFRIVLIPDATGQAYTFQLSTSEGVVLFSGTVPAGTPGTEVAVDAGTEVSVTAEVNPATNAVTVTQISAPQTISAEAAQQITAAVTEAITQAQQATVFTPTEQQQAASNPPTSTPPTNQPQTQTQQPKPDTQPQVTPPTNVDPSTRSGSGE